jgi:hypothetical protein
MLRDAGVRTIGRFVWESFGPQHVRGATSAFDTIYSLTVAERLRYRTMGIDAVPIPWGCHPELLAVDRRVEAGVTRFFYPAGFLSPRKPTGAVLEAFRRVPLDDVRLVVKAQRRVRRGDLRRPNVLADVDRRLTPLDRIPMGRRWIRDLDPRIELEIGDLPLDAYYARFASCDVCVGVSRWEGLGLHLYEATGFAMPILGSAMAPVDEVAIDGLNAINVPSRVIGRRSRSGVDAHEPDVRAMTLAFESFADPDVLAARSRGAEQRRDELRWDATVAALAHLLDTVSR